MAQDLRAFLDEQDDEALDSHTALSISAATISQTATGTISPTSRSSCSKATPETPIPRPTSNRARRLPPTRCKQTTGQTQMGTGLPITRKASWAPAPAPRTWTLTGWPTARPPRPPSPPRPPPYPRATWPIFSISPMITPRPLCASTWTIPGAGPRRKPSSRPATPGT